MDGIRNIAGRRTVKRVIAGKEYTLSPKVLGQYADREDYILALKPHPLDVIASMAPVGEPPPLVAPLGPGATAEQHAQQSIKTADYKRRKREYDERLSCRQRLERMAWEESLRPRVVSLADDQAFDQSLHGIGFRLWKALERDHPEINSVQAALDLIEAHGLSHMADITQSLDVAEEKDILGNSIAAGPGPAAESPGATSTPQSPTDMDGHHT